MQRTQHSPGPNVCIINGCDTAAISLRGKSITRLHIAMRRFMRQTLIRLFSMWVMWLLQSACNASRIFSLNFLICYVLPFHWRFAIKKHTARRFQAIDYTQLTRAARQACLSYQCPPLFASSLQGVDTKGPTPDFSRGSELFPPT